MADEMNFELKIPNLDKIIAAFTQAPALMTPIFQKTIDATEALFAKNTTTKTVPHITDNLIISFGFRTMPLKATWGPNRNTPAPYAAFVEFGTRPHEILPINKQALYWKGAEHPVKRVEHPGSKANPFM